jgi:hypothetical protein
MLKVHEMTINVFDSGLVEIRSELACTETVVATTNKTEYDRADARMVVKEQLCNLCAWSGADKIDEVIIDFQSPPTLHFIYDSLHVFK